MRQPNILLEGPSGTGKTYSLRTLVEAGITPFCIFTEPRFSCLEDIPDEKLHWKYIPPGTVTWASMISGAKLINALSTDALQKQSGIEKNRFTQFIDILTQMNDFKCDRCGKAFGDVTTWAADSGRAVVIDGLSGLSKMSIDLQCGSKPIKTQPDWGVGMDNLERFLDQCTNSIQCLFVLIAHVEPERDEVSGSVYNMVSTLGRKLAPKIPRQFDEIILARRDGTNFYWATSSHNTDTKASRMPLGEKLPPDFAQIISAYKAKP